MAFYDDVDELEKKLENKRSGLTMGDIDKVLPTKEEEPSKDSDVKKEPVEQVETKDPVVEEVQEEKEPADKKVDTKETEAKEEELTPNQIKELKRQFKSWKAHTEEKQAFEHSKQSWESEKTQFETNKKNFEANVNKVNGELHRLRELEKRVETNPMYQKRNPDDHKKAYEYWMKQAQLAREAGDIDKYDELKDTALAQKAEADKVEQSIKQFEAQTKAELSQAVERRNHYTREAVRLYPELNDVNHPMTQELMKLYNHEEPAIQKLFSDPYFEKANVVAAQLAKTIMFANNAQKEIEQKTKQISELEAQVKELNKKTSLESSTPNRGKIKQEKASKDKTLEELERDITTRIKNKSYA